MKVYRKQNNLTLKLSTGIKLENIQTALIKYIKPNGAIGQWTGTVSGSQLTYQFTSTDLDRTGKWTVCAHITFVNTNVAVGEAATFIVYEQGQ
jgi:hypothetical protein